MRIAYFSARFPRPTETFLVREIEGLRRAGIEVYPFALHRPGDHDIVDDDQRTERDRTTYVLPSSPLTAAVSQLRLLVKSPQRYIATLKLAHESKRPGIKGSYKQVLYMLEAGVLSHRVRAAECTHIHAHFGDLSTTVAMLTASFSGLPYSFTLHGSGIFLEAYDWKLDQKIRHAKFVVTISWFCRSQALILGTEAAADKVFIVHCGVQPRRYTPDAVWAHRASDAPVRLVFVARLDNGKGVSDLLEASRQLRDSGLDFHLTIVGDGPLRSQFEDTMHEHNLDDRVEFAGYQSQDGVAAILATADISVLLSYGEGVPTVLMEAHAAGLPVVATNTGGVSELVIHGETGFLVPPGDVDTFCHAVRVLAADPELRHRMGMAGAKRVHDHFDSNIEAARLAQLFTSFETQALPVRPLPLGR